MRLWDWFKDALGVKRNLPLNSWPVGKALTKYPSVDHSTINEFAAHAATFNDPPDTESDFDKLYPLE